MLANVRKMLVRMSTAIFIKPLLGSSSDSA
jgi:hypothetical protein